jgi:aspartate kinase
MKHLQSANIPLHLKNVNSPQGLGTLIFPSDKTSQSNSRRASPDRRAFMNAHGYEGEDQSRRTPAAITSKKGIALINLVPNGTTNKYELLAEVISRLARLKIVPDLLCTSEQSVSFAIPIGSCSTTVDEIAEEIECFGNVSVRSRIPAQFIVVLG